MTETDKTINAKSWADNDLDLDAAVVAAGMCEGHDRLMAFVRIVLVLAYCCPPLARQMMERVRSDEWRTLLWLVLANETLAEGDIENARELLGHYDPPVLICPEVNWPTPRSLRDYVNFLTMCRVASSLPAASGAWAEPRRQTVLMEHCRLYLDALRRIARCTGLREDRNRFRDAQNCISGDWYESGSRGAFWFNSLWDITELPDPQALGKQWGSRSEALSLSIAQCDGSGNRWEQLFRALCRLAAVGDGQRAIEMAKGRRMVFDDAAKDIWSRSLATGYSLWGDNEQARLEATSCGDHGTRSHTYAIIFYIRAWGAGHVADRKKVPDVNKELLSRVIPLSTRDRDQVQADALTILNDHFSKQDLGKCDREPSEGVLRARQACVRRGTPEEQHALLVEVAVEGYYSGLFGGLKPRTD